MTPENLLERVRRTTVLTYHKVDPRREVGVNCLPPDKFEQQLHFLQSDGFTAITFADLLNSTEIPDRPVILTFDDAYESVYSNAAPLMHKRGMRGVVFAISGFVGRDNLWDANLGGITFRHMNYQQIAELLSAGWEIGGHGVTHRSLTHLSGNAIDWEVNYCRQELQNTLSAQVATFAYPFGQLNAAALRSVKAAGFTFAVGGASGRQAVNLLHIPRYSVYQFESLPQFQNKLQHPVPTLENLKLRLLNLPAKLTPYYQRLFKRKIFSGNQFDEDLYS